MSAEQKDCGQTAPAPPDPAASLGALSWCLRALACDCGLVAAERSHRTPQGRHPRIPGACAADLQAAQMILATTRRLSGRRWDQATQLSISFAELAKLLRGSER